MRSLTALAAALAAALVLTSEARVARANRPDGAYGSYHVTVFLPESDGSSDPNLEDWTADMEDEVVDQVLAACLFWAETAPDSAGLTCDVGYYHYDDTPTSSEPITHDGGAPLFGFWGGDEDDWINDIMDVLGYSSIWLFYYQEVEDYNDAAQAEHGTDEAFSAFVVNSLNDEDGSFANDMSAYVPELRAPYLVMTWDNGNWRDVLGPEHLRVVGAHEMGHLFGAHDEYSGSNSDCDDLSNGYPNANHEDCPAGTQTFCLMRNGVFCSYHPPYPLCYWTRGQVGWEPECEPPTGVCGSLGRIECANTWQCFDGTEQCDGVAQCDDAWDELGCAPCDADEFRCDNGECSRTWAYCVCPDADGDGHRDASCGGDDCDDGDAQAAPGAAERCNGEDDDCDGDVDEGLDEDHDGYPPCGDRPDCDDDDINVYPGAYEICGDGVDQDCSGADLTCDCPDMDGDGHRSNACGGDDCDDLDPEVLGGWPDCWTEPECDGGPCDPPADGGPEGREPDGGGCECSTSGPSSASKGGLLLASLLLLALRRGRGRGR